jgi:hypothetical protein
MDQMPVPCQIVSQLSQSNAQLIEELTGADIKYVLWVFYRRKGELATGGHEK